MDKKAIFNEFKKTQEEKEVKKENEIKDEQKEIIKVPENIVNKNRYKKNKKRNKNKKQDKTEVKVINTISSFDKWKEEFLSDETNKEFMNLLQFYRDKSFTVFTDDDFLKNKYEHPNMRTVVLDPTLLEINAGKGGTCYLIKPIYTDEYNYFLKNIGTRDQKPEEFMKYAIKVGVLYPKFTDEMLDKTGAGTILALYNYILQFSDLTKTIKILEV